MFVLNSTSLFMDTHTHTHCYIAICNGMLLHVQVHTSAWQGKLGNVHTTMYMVLPHLEGAQGNFLLTELYAVSWLSMHIRAIRCEIPFTHMHTHTHTHTHTHPIAAACTHSFMPTFSYNAFISPSHMHFILSLAFSLLLAVQFSFLCFLSLSLFHFVCWLFTCMSRVQHFAGYQNNRPRIFLLIWFAIIKKYGSSS